MERDKNSRWQINKLGIINFWYYDKEEIFLEDGKLLLRGGNGSGKSVTLQSFIPLLLDGNRSPSRLDPFGSASRKLENYMLMDENENERTAYLYMEMKKKGVENYITVGMGIKAQKDKALDTWYFIIRDGKRIGKEIELLKKSPEGHVVLQKKQLKNLLQENGYFTEYQNQYMEKMNEIFFGFADIGNYQDLLSLLINIRAPKLSKDLKPTKMYEILNKSLKTLDEEELRGVTDAIEEMERISSKIEEQRKALNSVNEIGEVYEEYNRVILSLKNSRYIEKTLKLESERGKSEKFSREFEDISENIEEFQKKIEETEIEKIAIQERKSVLQRDDAFWKIEEKLRAEGELKKLRRESERLREKSGEKTEERKKKLNENEKFQKSLDEISDIYLELESQLKEQLKNLNIAFIPEWGDIRDELKKFKELLNSLKKDIREYERVKEAENELQDALEKNRLDLKGQNKETLRLENLLVETSEQIKEEIIGWHEGVKYLKFSDEELIKIFDFINCAAEEGVISEIIGVVRERYFELRNSYILKLEKLKPSLNREKNEKRLVKENIPFEDLKTDTGLDLFLVAKEFRDKVSKIVQKDGGHFLISDESLMRKEDGLYQLGELLGKDPDIHKTFTVEELKEVLKELERELENFISLKDLEAGRELLLKNNDTIERLEASAHELKDRLEEERKRLRELDEKLFPKLHGTFIEKNLDSIEAFEEVREEAIENLNEIIMKEREKEIAISQIREREDDINRFELEIDEYNQLLSDANKEMTLTEERLSTLSDSLKLLDVEKILNELKILEEREKILTQLLKEYSIELGKNQNRKNNLITALADFKEKIMESEVEMEKYEKFYKEELQLGYCGEDEISSDVSENSVKQLELLLNETLNRNANMLQQFRIRLKMIFIENADSQRYSCTYMMEGKDHPFMTLSEFLKNQLENLEILITKNNKKIFEETLLENLGNKVLAEVQNSQRWIKEINNLMDRMESSSSLKLELKWEPRKSEIQGELDTQEITAILKNRDRISENEVMKFREHFSKKLKNSLRLSRGENVNSSCHAVVKEVLDYREWFDFKLYYVKKNERKREMTNNNFEQFSGGEKAISMYLPLLAALYARYGSASESAPRIVAMDEAFAGVDEKNIGLLFSHLENLELDYVLNSQILWGDYETISKLAVTEIIREENDKQVALINYRWNGKKLSEREEKSG